MLVEHLKPRLAIIAYRQRPRQPFIMATRTQVLRANPAMTDRLHINRLEPKSRAIWDRLGELPDHFVLIGGAALALKLDHRSVSDLILASRDGWPYSAKSRPEEFLGRPLGQYDYRFFGDQGQSSIEIFETKNLPRITIHYESETPTMRPPHREANGLLVADLHDSIWRTLIDIPRNTTTESVMDAVAGFQTLDESTMSRVLTAAYSVGIPKRIELADIADALSDTRKAERWAKSGNVDLKALKSLAHKVRWHRPSARDHFVSAFPDGGLGSINRRLERRSEVQHGR